AHGGYGHHGGRFGPWEERAREVHDEWHRQHDRPAGDAAGVSPGSGQAGGGPSGSGPSGSGPSGTPSSGGNA
ncbi:MAG: hypothetical protein AB1736_06325, partial [Chloroflexota bacterium]